MFSLAKPRLSVQPHGLSSLPVWRCVSCFTKDTASARGSSVRRERDPYFAVEETGSERPDDFLKFTGQSMKVQSFELKAAGPALPPSRSHQAVELPVAEGDAQSSYQPQSTRQRIVEGKLQEWAEGQAQMAGLRVFPEDSLRADRLCRNPRIRPR